MLFNVNRNLQFLLFVATAVMIATTGMGDAQVPPVAVIPVKLSTFVAPTTGATVGCTVAVTVGAVQKLQLELGLDMGFDWLMVTSSDCNSSIYKLCGQGSKYIVIDPEISPPFSNTYGFGLFKAAGVETTDSLTYPTTATPLVVSPDQFAAKIGRAS